MAITVGIAGFGMSGRLFHAPFIHANPGFRLKSILERHSEECLKVYPDVTVVREFNSLLNDPGIDLVVISLPNEFHYPLTKEALLAGKHVVVEKPFTNSVAKADELIALSLKQDRKIFVYQNRRWDGDFLTLRKILDKGLLGEVLEYEATFNRYRPVATGKAWREAPNPGSGVLFDLSPHLVDQAMVLFGEPQAIWADIRTQRPGGRVDDYFEIKMFYGSLKVTLKAGVFVPEPGPRYAVHGRLGSWIKYGLDPQEEALRKGHKPGMPGWGEEEEVQWGLIHRIFEGNSVRERMQTEAGNYMAFYDNVLEVLTSGSPQAVNPQEARNVIRIIELALESHHSEKIIPYLAQAPA